MTEKIKVTVGLEIEVEDDEEKGYFINPQTGEAAASFIADTLDNADQMVGTLISVNGYTKEQIQEVLNAELGI